VAPLAVLDSVPSVLASGGSSASDVWSQVTSVQPAVPYLIVVLTAVAALAVVAAGRLWHLFRNAITIAHEGGHALVAVLCGRRLRSIRLHSDTSGLTVTRGRPTGFGMVLTLMAGYLFPSLIGIGGAALLAAHRVTLGLWIYIVLLLLMLLMIRNLYGVLTVIITGGVAFLVSWYASTQVQAVFAYFAVWLLLIGGVRPLFELAGQRRRREVSGSDVDQLAGLTHIAGIVWLAVFTIVTCVLLVFGASLLGLLHVPPDGVLGGARAFFS
jgi:Peptidase M50B-like